MEIRGLFIFLCIANSLRRFQVFGYIFAETVLGGKVDGALNVRFIFRGAGEANLWGDVYWTQYHRGGR